MTILTTLADYAKQKGVTRARAYQLQSKLPTIDLPVNVTVTYEGKVYQVDNHKGTTVQTFVQQDRTALEAELIRLNAEYVKEFIAHNVPAVNRICSMIQAIENNLK